LAALGERSERDELAAEALGLAPQVAAAWWNRSTSRSRAARARRVARVGVDDCLIAVALGAQPIDGPLPVRSVSSGSVSWVCSSSTCCSCASGTRIDGSQVLSGKRCARTAIAWPRDAGVRAGRLRRRGACVLARASTRHRSPPRSRAARRSRASCRSCGPGPGTDARRMRALSARVERRAVNWAWRPSLNRSVAVADFASTAITWALTPLRIEPRSGCLTGARTTTSSPPATRKGGWSAARSRFPARRPGIGLPARGR